MTPEEFLTRWEVRTMISDAIEKYDGVNTDRHEEHTKKLDRLTYLIIGTLLTVVGGIFTEVVLRGR